MALKVGEKSDQVGTLGTRSNMVVKSLGCFCWFVFALETPNLVLNSQQAGNTSDDSQNTKPPPPKRLLSLAKGPGKGQLSKT